MLSRRARFERALDVLVVFLRIGLFTFGGGWSIVAQLQKEFVERRRWLSEEELIDITSVGRSLPGLMTGNIGMMLGNRVGGPLCGLAAVIGMSVPPLAILAVIAVSYEAVRSDPYISRAFVGIRAAVVPIIGASVLRMRKAAFPRPVTWAIGAIAFVLALATSVNKVFLVLAGALAGLLLMRNAASRPGQPAAAAVGAPSAERPAGLLDGRAAELPEDRP